MSGARTCVVVNPARVPRVGDFRATIDGALAVRELPPARYLPTTPADPGAGQALRALDDGASRVLAAGGDGTVRMVLGALRDTGLPVGILPVGTGNLLARNLRLPQRLGPAVDVALDGAPRPLDLIGYEVLDTGERGHGCVMAGLGADAAVVADAGEGLKRLGRLGYALAGLRHVRARPVASRITVDGEVLVRDASLAAVGNVAELRRGLPLFPEADGSDGSLHALVASPRHAGDVLRMGAGVLMRSPGISLVDRRVGREVVIECAEPVPGQVDGDLLGAVRAIRFEVLPGAATVARGAQISAG